MTITLHTLCGCTKIMEIDEPPRRNIRVSIKREPTTLDCLPEFLPGETRFRIRTFKFTGFTGVWYKMPHYTEVWE